MIPSRPGLRSRRSGRRIRRYLGLPAFSPRTVLVILLIFFGMTYLSVTVLADFLATLVSHAPSYYELQELEKHFQRGK